MTRLSLAKERVQILLLEGIHENAVADLAAEGYANVTRLKGALDEDELIRRLEGVHLLGIRSRTLVTPRVLEAADRLIAIGCFCIGTDQVALKAAKDRGIPVFNDARRLIGAIAIGGISAQEDVVAAERLVAALGEELAGHAAE